MKKFTSTLFIVLLCVKAFASGHTVTISATNVTCNGMCDGTAGSTVSGGIGPFGFSWIGTSGFTSTAQNVVGLCAGTYTVTVTDNSDMSISTASVTIAQAFALLLVPSPNDSICIGQLAQIYSAGYGGTPPYTYTYSPTMPPPGPPYTVTPTVTTSYTVFVTDANGCISSPQTITIYVSATPYANFTMVPDSTNGLNYYAFNSTTGNGLIYNWDFGDGGSSTLQSPTHLYSSTGTYTVILNAINTLTGCQNTVSHTITVNSTPASCLSLFNIAFDTTSTDPYAYTVYNLSYGSALNYLWSFGDGTSSTLQNPTHVYGGGGPYQLCLTVDNGSGCTQTYCDSLMYVDSLSRTSNYLSINVVDGNPSMTTGIKEYSLSSSVEVYPNPFSDNTTFVIQSEKANEKYSFELVDVVGKKVRSMNEISTKQFTISRNGLENGIYFYKIYSAESIVGIGKLIVN